MGLFSPLKIDLSNSILEEFQQPEFEGYGPKPSKSVSEDTSNKVRGSLDAPLIEELMPKTVNNARPNSAVVNVVRANQVNAVKDSSCWGSGRPPNLIGHPQKENQGYVDSRCSRRMTRNMSYLSDFKEFDGGYVTFGGGAKGGKITSKGTLKTGKLDFEDVYFVKELQFNLFSVSQMCDKKNSVLFTNTGCFVLSPEFMLADESQVLLKVPRKNNMYSVDIKNIVPKESLTCLVAKATLDESMLWHRRLGHVKFKTINKLVKENLVRGLPSKHFENDQTCVACLKGKQHKASFDKKVKIIRCDNGTEFKNRVMSEFCEQKGIKREFSVARTPQQNGVAERRNRTLIEAARTMLADSKLPTTFWAEAVNTTCYVQNRFLEDKPIIAGDGPKWLFDIDVLTKSMNNVPVVAGTNSNDLVGTEESIGTSHSSKETGSSQDYILMPMLKDGLLFDSSLKNASDDEPQPSNDAKKKDDEGVNKESRFPDQEKSENSTQGVNTAGPSINTKPNMFSLGDNATIEATHADLFSDETEVDMRNITTTYQVPSTPNTRIHKDHSLDHVIGDVQSGVKTRRMTKTINKQGFISAVYDGKTYEDLHTCLFACFLSYEEPKKQVWTLVDLPYGKRAIGTKWVYRNNKDEKGIVIRNKARLVMQGYIQEEGIDYDEVFAPVSRIKSIRLFLAYASFKDFVVYQMDVKSAFLYEKALYGLHQAPRAWYETLSTYLLDNGFQRGKIDKNLFIKRVKGSSSTRENPQNVAFVSSNSTNSNCNSSTNEADNTAHRVSATHTQCNSTSGDNLSDAMICAFLASQPNSPQLAREDLEQIDPDDLEEMDLQWEMAMLTIRARRFIQRTGRKLDVNGQRVGFDRTKVECYNCHKYGHFARECRVPRNQENRGRENNRRTVTVETPTENALVAQDGLGGYDWSYQAEEEHPTNFALMAHTSSGSSSSSDSEVDSCSKLCVKAYATLNEQYDSLSLDYKSLLNAVESFVNSSEMLENQKNNKSKSDKGYHAVPPPFTWNFIPRKPD
ncbi:putative ribonuclease H-like domain-containing protein [Tanacetum coccineum]|uniref:Ribonuclease H-like domain-containing protein n=1 Tax=Tanacetum coccineum TaxID=301880 RepID=A0ABQ5DNP5_9ASTR